MRSDIPNVRQEILEEITCRNDAGREIVVIRFRYVATELNEGGLRDRPGAQSWKTASNAEPVRLLDRNLYEVISSGEMLERVS